MLRSALFALALTAVAAPVSAQTGSTKKPGPTKTPVQTRTPPAAPKATTVPYSGKTTLNGVYTRDEAAAGKEIFAGLCSSCHPIAQHSGGIFRAKWAGRPLLELFTYMKTAMPKSDP